MGSGGGSTTTGGVVTGAGSFRPVIVFTSANARNNTRQEAPAIVHFWPALMPRVGASSGLAFSTGIIVLVEVLRRRPFLNLILTVRAASMAGASDVVSAMAMSTIGTSCVADVATSCMTSRNIGRTGSRLASRSRRKPA